MSVAMKKTIGAYTFLALLLATRAMAADVPLKAPIYSPPPAIDDWSGVYLGMSLGGRSMDTTWSTTGIGSPIGLPDPTTTPATFTSTTFRPGGYIGYNWEWAPASILSVEADAAWGRNKVTVAGIPGTYGSGGQGAGLGATAFDTATVSLSWDGSLRARIGVLVNPEWLIYATAGLALQQVDVTATCNGSGFNSSWCVAVRSETYSKTLTGWTVGGGIEARLWNNWLLRAEYRYADYGTIAHTFFAGSNIDEVAMEAAVKSNTALLGIAYKF